MVENTDSKALEILPIVDKMKTVSSVMCDKIKSLNEVIAIKSNFSDQREEIMFSDLMAKVKQAYSKEIIKGRTIIKEDYSNCSKINYNSFQLETILQNLMSNALKYKHSKRKLIIKIATKEIDGEITLSFKDNGLGFNQGLAKKTFKLFKRMHTHVEGLGIGLYIVHSIINRNGGDIRVTSHVNKGTEFIIQLK